MEKIDEYVKSINLSDVETSDRLTVRCIIKGLILFDSTRPELETSIQEAQDHYMLQIKGYIKRICIKQWYETFLGSNRLPPYESIAKAQCIPTPDAGNGPLFIITIVKPKYVDDEDEVYELADSLDSLQLAVDYNESQVKKNDKWHVRSIIRSIYMFDKIMPKLSVEITPKHDSYYIQINSWNSAFDIKKWYVIFLSINRTASFDQLFMTQCVPSVPGGDSVLLVVISKIKFSKSTISKSTRYKRRK